MIKLQPKQPPSSIVNQMKQLRAQFSSDTQFVAHLVANKMVKSRTEANVILFNLNKYKNL
jgi:hypothetical protein